MRFTLQTPLSILKQYWHHQSFRPQQEEIIESVLNGKDTLAILPTGGGKSICYQIPALLLDGACLVVSPLIALMKDQALGLEQRGIKCLVAHSGLSNQEVRRVYENMSSGEYKFLFVSPERLKSVLFLDYLSDWNIRLLAIDEAHCISQWGYDFRPAYLDIAFIKESLTLCTIIALTASATPFVQQDIIEKLGFTNHALFFTTFFRPNLSFSVFEPESKLQKTIDILQKVKGTSVVYCRMRKRTKEIADALNHAGLSADYYHAGLDQTMRNQKQDDWMNNKTSIIVCTNAFGMGIDKSDVRCVVHFDMPDTPEAYYQEAGRAGRDDQRAFAVLLFTAKDVVDLKDGIELKYPPIENIKKIYESLAYYFEIALHHGFETTHDFDVMDYCKKFQFNIIEVLNTIQLLEQQGYWTLSESVFLPSRISLTCSKDDIESIENSHPELDEILKYVLRMYAGLWMNYIPINELHIAQHAGVSRDYVQMILRKLNKLGILHYIEAKDKPQFFYLHDRVPLHELKLNISLIADLKKRYRERVEFMLAYSQQKTNCRAIKLVDYFKEDLVIPCGLCDICLAKKHGSISKEEFENMRDTILSEIALCKSMNISLFSKKYSSLKQEKIVQIIRLMLDERLVELNEKGELMIKK